VGHLAQRLATVLGALPDETRLDLAARLVPASYVIVPRRVSAEIETVFKVTASRIHAGLKAELKFHPAAVGFCWQAMIEKAAFDPDAEKAEPEPPRAAAAD
jgi:hypothetical protein